MIENAIALAAVGVIIWVLSRRREHKAWWEAPERPTENEDRLREWACKMRSIDRCRLL